MPITLRSQREIKMLRSAGLVVAKVLSKLKEHAQPGVSTAELDDIAMEMTRAAGGVAFRGVRKEGGCVGGYKIVFFGC